MQNMQICITLEKKSRKEILSTEKISKKKRKSKGCHDEDKWKE